MNNIEAILKSAPRFGEAESREGVMIDVTTRTPMKVYDVPQSSCGPTFKLKFTWQQREVLEEKKDGFCLQGRSGTGKTEVLCRRMVLHAAALVPEVDGQGVRLLFVAPTVHLCDLARNVFVRESGTKALGMAAFQPLHKEVLPDLERSHTGLWGGEAEKEVGYLEFLRDYWPELETHCRLSPRLVWTKIVSVIKGSLRAVKNPKGHLERDAYVMELGAKEDRLEEGYRENVYAAFERYQGLLRQRKAWDRADRVMAFVQDILVRAKKQCPQSEAGPALRRYLGSHNSLKPMERVYVDEVQDYTQAELLLLTIAGGGDMSRLLLAGDTAQQCVAGVEAPPPPVLLNPDLTPLPLPFD